MKMEEINGEFWGDTPGLDDVQSRELAAKEIAKAFRHGTGMHRLIFVVTEEGLRVRPADLATMTLVLDAVNVELKQKGSFGVIINKMEPQVKMHLQSNKDYFDLFRSALEIHGYSPSKILLYPRIEALILGNNVVHTPSQELLDFVESMEPFYVNPSQVKDIEYDKFEKLQEAYEKSNKEIAKTKKWLKITALGASVVTGAAGLAAYAAVGAAAATTAEVTAAAAAAVAESAAWGSFWQGVGHGVGQVVAYLPFLW